jgi:hypothetical protein
LEIVMISMVVNDESQVAEARRGVVAIARQQGFNEVDAGRAALVATELATNLVKHARSGELLWALPPMMASKFSPLIGGVAWQMCKPVSRTAIRAPALQEKG